MGYINSNLNTRADEFCADYLKCNVYIMYMFGLEKNIVVSRLSIYGYSFIWDSTVVSVFKLIMAIWVNISCNIMVFSCIFFFNAMFYFKPSVLLNWYEKC